MIFIWTPVFVMMIPLLIGLFSESIDDPAFRVLIWVVALWNAWHFGAQNFGLASIFGWRLGPRWIQRAGIIGTTMAAMLLIPISIVGLIVSEVLGLFHWIGDIGITTFVMRRFWLIFIPAVLVVGLVGFFFNEAVVNPHCSFIDTCRARYALPLLVSCRYSLGLWHFLMSRWVWQLSNPVSRNSFMPAHP
jgi:hypothetical protein